MLHSAILRTLFLYVLFNVYIKIWFSLHCNLFHQYLCEISNGYGVKYISSSSQTSVLGSNIFFNNKHSLGIPTGSTTGVGITCAGRPEAGITPGLPIGMLKACWTGTDPFTIGTPMLQFGNMWKNCEQIHKNIRGKYYTNLVGMSAPANLCISSALEWAFKVCIKKYR